MGHHTTEQDGTGASLKEARENAVADFLYENGHRCNVYKVAYLKHERVPPVRARTTVRAGMTYIDSVPDPSVPQDQWDYRATFELTYHA